MESCTIVLLKDIRNERKAKKARKAYPSRPDLRKERDR